MYFESHRDHRLAAGQRRTSWLHATCILAVRCVCFMGASACRQEIPNTARFHAVSCVLFAVYLLGAPPVDIPGSSVCCRYVIRVVEAIACMTCSSDLRPFSVLSQVKATTVLKRDTIKVEVRPPKVTCEGLVLKGVRRCITSSVNVSMVVYMYNTIPRVQDTPIYLELVYT